MEKWAMRLTASGNPARWNSPGKFVIYTANSRALACLENLVHRAGESQNHLFKVMVIEIPKHVKIEEFKKTELPEGWFEPDSYDICQQMGDEWLLNQTSAVLKVPSAIIKEEHNFLINSNHKDFKSIKLVSTENFEFDPRFDEK